MITNEQIIDALLAGYNSHEDCGRFNPESEDTLCRELTERFGFNWNRDRIEEAVLPACPNPRYIYSYKDPLYHPEYGDLPADIRLTIREDGCEQKVFLYRIKSND